MSLELLQGYSSASEEGEGDDRNPSSSLSDNGDDDEDEDDDGEEERGDEPLASRSNRSNGAKKSPSDAPKPSPDSAVPSALEAFAECTGPPDFLNNCVAAPEETREALGVLDRRARDRSKRDKKDLPAGAVLEGKPQLVAIRDRVRSDVEGSTPSSGHVTLGETKRVITAANPGAQDAAELLRMCLQCGVPKTYSHTRGVVCPICGDRPPAEVKEPDKKKGSTIKEKEKSKRMRGQSTHSAWKSETEMQLRQQYD
ncbi:chromatin modification-related protein EAF7 [Ananas comosus]|uniref:Chromatin modification-related protein EAF7 n=1 Tax=Ananas comosus TaxID=4615 RepID=A0A6P5FBC5_ANACO|nr:chromatin modification-related protein EAF7 [Ananas comosus]